MFRHQRKFNQILLLCFLSIMLVGTVVIVALALDAPIQESLYVVYDEGLESLPAVASEGIESLSVVTEDNLNTYYDIPLDKEFQTHVIRLSEEANMDPCIIFAIIWHESRYQPDVVGDSGDSLGMMQIQPKWKEMQDRIARLGITNLLDGYQNVMLGIDIISDYYEELGDIETALITYQCGPTGAEEYFFSQGVYSNEFTQAVLNQADIIRASSYQE